MRDVEEYDRRALIIMLAMLIPQVLFSFIMVGGVNHAAAEIYFYRDRAALAFSAGAVIAGCYVFLSMRSLPYIRERWLEISWIQAIAILFALGSATLEELFFRRFLMNTLGHAGVGLALQVVISGLAFGLAHSVWGMLSRSWRGVLMPVVWTTVLGWLLAGVFLLGGRDPAPCIWSHAAINLFLEPWLMISLMARHRSSSTRASVALGSRWG